MTTNLGTCSGLAASPMSGISLDSAGGVLSCVADGVYSASQTSYPSGCGAYSATLISTYWQTGAGKVLTVSGSRICHTSQSSDSASIDAQFSTAAKQLASSGWFWGCLSIGILFAYSVNSIAYGIGAIRRMVESGAE